MENLDDCMLSPLTFTIICSSALFERNLKRNKSSFQGTTGEQKMKKILPEHKIAPKEKGAEALEFFQLAVKNLSKTSK